jgi:hypothetical protein
MADMYLVYEIESDVDLEPDTKKPYTVFSAEPLGAYVAKNETRACRQAARRYSRGGTLGAVKIELRKVAFDAQSYGAGAMKELVQGPVKRYKKARKG